MNLFRDSRTPLDPIRDKLLTLIYFLSVQCPSVGDDMVQCKVCEEWLHMSYEGLKTALEGKWLCIVCRPLDSKRLLYC